MQLNQLKPVHRKKQRKRVGRGGKKGTYSGRGLKGQKARAGRKPRPGFAGGDSPLAKRLPKRRGERGRLKIRQSSKSSNRLKPVILNLRDIEENFKKNELVSPKSLLEKGLIVKMRKKNRPVKILGQGQLKKKLIFKGVVFSKQSEQKIKQNEYKAAVKKKK